MNAMAILNIILAVLALPLALINFFNAGLIWKLISLVILNGIFLYFAVESMKKWIKPRPRAGIQHAPAPKEAGRVAATVGALFAICLIFSAFQIFIVDKNTIRVTEGPPSDQVFKFKIKGAYLLATQVNIQLPPRNISTCTPKASLHDRAIVNMVDYDKATPQLKITNFSSPQKVFVECTPLIKLDMITIRANPPDIKVFFPFKWAKYIKWILIIGGVLCAASIAYLCFRL